SFTPCGTLTCRSGGFVSGRTAGGGPVPAPDRDRGCPDSSRLVQNRGSSSSSEGMSGSPGGRGRVLGTVSPGPSRYAALASAPIPLSTHHGSAMPSSAAAVVWLTTASGATCCWSTSHIVFTDAGAAVGVEYPRNSVVSSGPSRRRVETPRSRHCAREKRERGGSG